MATKVTSSLINTISASQIQASGATAGQVLTYNGSTSTWVASAVPQGTTASSFLSTGYATFGGGLMIQWGRYTGTLDDTGTSIVLPTPFPNAFLNVVTSCYKPSASTGVISSHAAITTSLSSFGLYGSGTADNPAGYYWQALGY